MARGESAFPPATVSNVTPLPTAPAVIFKPTLASVLPDDLPPREFIVSHLIPKRELTLFSGQPNIGKSWLTMMLMCACGLGKSWLRCPGTRRCKSLAVFSEDPEDQLKIRLDAICNHYGAEPGDLELSVSWIDRSTIDPVIFKGAGRFSSKWQTMPLWQEIRRYIKDDGIELLILDNASTVALIYDNDQHVTSFCRWLISEAEELDIAIVLLLHPPASDNGGEKWYAGSRKWAQSVRNALVVQKIRRKAGDERPWWEDDGRRVLLAPKNNYLPHDHWMLRRGMMLQWQDGVLQRTGA